MFLSQNFLLLLGALPPTTSALPSSPSAFNPSAFKKQFVACPAINRATNENININLSYVDLKPLSGKAKGTLLLVHGWPGLWSTWVNQIQEFKNDYRLIIPDQRGFGQSTHPGDVKSSGTMFDMVSDMICVLKNAGVKTTTCIGHDWGSPVCYEAARERPDVFTAVAGLDVPYIPSDGQFTPIKALTPVFPKLTYQVFFDERTSDAVVELNADIRKTIRATLRATNPETPAGFLESNATFMGPWDGIDIPPVPFLSSVEEDYVVQQYTIQGFDNTLQFYTQQNRFAGWELAHNQGNFTIPVPLLAVYPTDDRVANWTEAAELLGSDKWLPQLTVSQVSGAHWPQIEFPEQVNSAIRSWLTKIRA